MDEGIEVLTNMFKGREWFHSVGKDQYGRYVVYCHFMCNETLHDVPDRVLEKQVLVHFAGSLLATREAFTNSDKPKRLELVVEESSPDLEELDSSLLKFDLTDLQSELDRLERQCGSNCLQDIFYEVHDGPNALTDNSARYPEVRKAMERLYQNYGFDIIYEELDG